MIFLIFCDLYWFKKKQKNKKKWKHEIKKILTLTLTKRCSVVIYESSLWIIAATICRRLSWCWDKPTGAGGSIVCLWRLLIPHLVEFNSLLFFGLTPLAPSPKLKKSSSPWNNFTEKVQSKYLVSFNNIQEKN